MAYFREGLELGAPDIQPRVQEGSWIWPGPWWLVESTELSGHRKQRQGHSVDMRCGEQEKAPRPHGPRACTQEGAWKWQEAGKEALYPGIVRGHQRVGVTVYLWSSTAWWRNTKRLWRELSAFLEVRRLEAKMYDLEHNPPPQALFASPEAEQDDI